VENSPCLLPLDRVQSQILEGRPILVKDDVAVFLECPRDERLTLLLGVIVQGDIWVLSFQD
jgi:hypothetical protein